ncbi:HlyD family type I secretion periplasmic adaptor subunit [Schlegelella sp. S2-27]|uniref:Membrane fusion protein (MFP) family protein n=1 Tax=Caldimonas mangrovi TaxID=2944811 RepID=A0ABT0YVQ2_9BURK|nr:HlyD family type I secretion periplasmic adaptor subunit [Caldimonas mangrovi]MCM5682839.1 HlyD family type I secretion periplasmic adaptor subunit [Caldimonas mangrovi]
MRNAAMTALTPASPATLADLLVRTPATCEQRAPLAALRRRMLWPVATVAALVGAWCAWAPLSGAVVATGQVQTELGRKTVQHQEGGIVRELLVRPGQRVARGEPLMVVADVRSDAAVDLLSTQRHAEQLRIERARAELATAGHVEWPADALPDIRAREQQLFDARRHTLAEQLAAMQAQMRDAHARISALSSELEAGGRSTALAREELKINESLAASGFIQKTRLMALQRGVAELVARAEATRGQIAEARMQVSEMQQAIAQTRGAYRQRAADEMKDAAARIRELDDRLRPTEDLRQRQTVRAPVDGTVMGLRVSAPGTAVGPREPLLEIVPAQEDLVIELRLDPHDIDHVHPGDAAEVRLSAYNARQVQLLQATVRDVSPDAVQDTEGPGSWFTAQVVVSPEELARHPQLRLQAGMPAEVFITTPPRSLLEYLLEPLGVFARRALREP